MRYLPVFSDVQGQPCLLVGGGALAARKLRLLVNAGARVTLLAEALAEETAGLAENHGIDVCIRAFEADDAAGMRLVFSASGSEETDATVSAAAMRHGVPVNVVDRPELSTFIVPAIVDRDPVVIGISSAGTAPVLARRIRASIEEMLPARLGSLARFAGSFRSAVAAVVPPAGRRRFWEEVFSGSIAELVLRGRESTARERMLATLNRTSPAARGSVAIVGAGPGDPELMTLKAMRLLQSADTIVYDRLVGEAVLGYARRDAERIYVGKAKGAHSMSQDDINALLVDRAKAGRRVVRLKGGDPFIFGRGGEELAVLKTHGVDAEVVPGITAAAGCAAAAGIPLTLRGESQALTLVTGHGEAGDPAIDWARLASADQTLAIYMGLSRLDELVARLAAEGLDPATPAAVIDKGTKPEQQIVSGRLDEIASRVRARAFEGPALIIVGKVARHAADGAVAPLDIERLRASA